MLALALAPDEAAALALRPTGEDAVDAAALWRRRDLDGLAALRAAAIGYVPQTGGLLPFLSVRDNVALPRRLLGLPSDGTVERLAETLGIADHLAKKPGALSIGQRQRTAVARALAHGPALVLADEPTASVDPATAEAVMELLVGETRRRGAALVVASHDWALLGRFDMPRLAPELRQERADGSLRVVAVFGSVDSAPSPVARADAVPA